MKILICGKGGSGKSTVASLLGKNLQAKGYRVLIVDSDESNFGLSAQLGLDEPKELMDELGGKKAVVDKMWANRSAYEKEKLFKEQWGIDQLPADCVTSKDNLYLMQIGKVKHFGEGCACPMGGLSRDFVAQLKLGEKDVAIIDTEAGVEHLGRGLCGNVDLALAVLDPSYESIRLSEKISSMANEAKKTAYFVLNKMDLATAESVAEKVGKDRVVGIVAFSSDVQQKGLSGEELDASKVDISGLTEFVLKKINGA
ncbi:MAG: P-loop NTPase [Candidatus Bathyarchaeota archaeon]|nr:P-loop NTPase [Candidatus Bathyarchaeota archaeon]